jgi:hypothetical protein
MAALLAEDSLTRPTTPSGDSHIAPVAGADLTHVIDAEMWEVTRPVLAAADARGIPFTVGGGPAYSRHAVVERPTKDMDLFVVEADKEALVAILDELGFRDYYGEKPYERSWIYRSHRDGVIVDVIWQLPNHRLRVDPTWQRRGALARVYDRTVRLLPPEATLLSKLYIVQPDRCDWPHLLNLLEQCGPAFDWDYLLALLDDRDLPVLGALLAMFGWLHADAARSLPEWLWERVGIGRPKPASEPVAVRASLLDTRDWFGPKTSDTGGEACG